MYCKDLGNATSATVCHERRDIRGYNRSHYLLDNDHLLILKRTRDTAITIVALRCDNLSHDLRQVSFRFYDTCGQFRKRDVLFFFFTCGVNEEKLYITSGDRLATHTKRMVLIKYLKKLKRISLGQSNYVEISS